MTSGSVPDRKGDDRVDHGPIVFHPAVSSKEPAGSGIASPAPRTPPVAGRSPCHPNHGAGSFARYFSGSRLSLSLQPSQHRNTTLPCAQPRGPAFPSSPAALSVTGQVFCRRAIGRSASGQPREWARLEDPPAGRHTLGADPEWWSLAPAPKYAEARLGFNRVSASSKNAPAMQTL